MTTEQSLRGPHNGSTPELSSRSVRSIMKRLLSAVPFGNALARTVLSLGFRNSPSYWEKRYAGGGNSGVGSYGEMADFKDSCATSCVRTASAA